MCFPCLLYPVIVTWAEYWADARPARSIMTNESYKDLDPLETREWMDSMEAVIEREGPERAHFILEKLMEHAHSVGDALPYAANTGYLNTVPTELEEAPPQGCASINWRRAATATRIL